MGRHRIDGVRAVAIESTFFSYRQMVRDKLEQLPILSLLRWPLSFLMVSNGYSPGKVVANIAPVPFLLIHGTDDRVIAFHHGKELFDNAKAPKQFWEIKDGRHTEAFTRYGQHYRQALVEFYKVALASE